MSANGVTVVVTFAAAVLPSLLTGIESNVTEPPDAMFVSELLFAGAVTVKVKLVTAPFVKLATGQVTRPFVNVKPALAVTNVTPEGTASVTTTLVAVDGPRLVRVIV